MLNSMNLNCMSNCNGSSIHIYFFFHPRKTNQNEFCNKNLIWNWILLFAWVRSPAGNAGASDPFDAPNANASLKSTLLVCVFRVPPLRVNKSRVCDCELDDVRFVCEQISHSSSGEWWELEVIGVRHARLYTHILVRRTHVRNGRALCICMWLQAPWSQQQATGTPNNFYGQVWGALEMEKN